MMKKSDKILELDKCYLEYLEGYSTCTYNYNPGEPRLMDYNSESKNDYDPDPLDAPNEKEMKMKITEDKRDIAHCLRCGKEKTKPYGRCPLVKYAADWRHLWGESPQYLDHLRKIIKENGITHAPVKSVRVGVHYECSIMIDKDHTLRIIGTDDDFKALGITPPTEDKQ